MISPPKRRSGGAAPRRQPPKASGGRGSTARKLFALPGTRQNRRPGPTLQDRLVTLRVRAPYIVGGVLLGVALAGLVSLLFPNTIPTRWLARLADYLFGWLAGVALAWIGAVGLALLAHQVMPSRGWAWRRVGGTGAIVLAMLVGDALDPSRAAGVIGRSLAVWLQAHLGS